MRLYFNATLFFYFCYFSTLCAQPIKQKNTFVDSTSIIYKNNKTENSKTKPATPKNKTASFLFKSYQNGIFQKNGCNYIIAKPKESALSVAERAKIPYYKLLKYNDLQDEDMLIAYQYMYLENKKSIFKQEVAFFDFNRTGELTAISI